MWTGMALGNLKLQCVTIATFFSLVSCTKYYYFYCFAKLYIMMCKIIIGIGTELSSIIQCWVVTNTNTLLLL